MRSGGWLMALGVVTAFLTVPICYPVESAAAAGASCKNLVGRHSGSIESVPVLFVHGVTSSAAEWTKSPPPGGRNMLAAVSEGA